MDGAEHRRFQAEALRQRLYAEIRDFFAARGVREVQTPILDPMGPMEPHIEGFCASSGRQQWFLRASPEFFHKRLLARGFGDLFEIARVFRAGEHGPRHRPEFTLLEWYRLGFDHRQLMAEVAALVQSGFALLGRALDVRELSYREWFAPLGLDPFVATAEEMAEAARAHGLEVASPMDREDWLMLLGAAILPRFHRANELLFVYGFPLEQAAYARILPGEPPTAARFEAFLGALEIANGYWEVTDLEEQRQRFAHDNAIRAKRGLPPRTVPPEVEAAFAQGLPECAGVALGIERLLMAMLGSEDIAEVALFP